VAKLGEAPSVARTRRDGRRQLLMYLAPEVVKDLKRAALDDDRPAYLLVEEAILEMLKKRKRSK
jgi:hypothetical protein